MAAEKCLGLVGKIAGHSYQPRYSKGASTLDITKMAAIQAVVFGDLTGAIEASRPVTYHGDVCTRCGDKVFRNVEKV